MAVAFRSDTKGTGTGTSIGLALPSGFAANDILEFRLYKENTNAVTWPSGFTPVTSINAADNSFVIYIARKVATGAESGTQTASWTGSNYAEAQLSAYSGADTSTTDDATPTIVASGVLGNSAVSPSITTVTANAMIIAFGANWASTTTNWTLTNFNMRTPSVTTDIGVADAIQAAVGASGNLTFSVPSTSGQAAGITVALREASQTGMMRKNVLTEQPLQLQYMEL